MKYIRVRKFLRAQTDLVKGDELMRGYSLSDLAVQYAREAVPGCLRDVIEIKNLSSANPALGLYTTNQADVEVPQNVRDAISQYVGVPLSDDQYNLIIENIRQGNEYFSNLNLDLSNVLLKNRILEVSTDNIQKAVSSSLNAAGEYPADVFDILDFHFNVVREVASTIVHESKHGDQEAEQKQTTQDLGGADEGQAESAESLVNSWFSANRGRVGDEIVQRLLANGTIDQEQYDYYHQNKV